VEIKEKDKGLEDEDSTPTIKPVKITDSIDGVHG